MRACASIARVVVCRCCVRIVLSAQIREQALVQFVQKAGTISSPVELFTTLRQRINPDENGVRSAFQHFRKLSSSSGASGRTAGHVTLAGFRGALRSFQILATDLCSESLFFDIDADGSGSVDFNEFCKAIAHAKVTIHEAEPGRLHQPGLVHPNDRERYANILKFVVVVVVVVVVIVECARVYVWGSKQPSMQRGAS